MALNSLALQAKEHWKKVRPKLYQSLKESRKLDQAAQRAADLTSERFGQAIENGLSHDQAWELVREQFVFLPSEEDVPNLGEDT